MTKSIHTTNRSQAGFTLVELAVVMIIIGLLIGGVLKGQELINNAQVTSTVAQLKGVEAATSSFRDSYSAVPGDMLSPSTRLPNCTAAPCSSAGNGNGRLGNTPAASPVGTEGEQFFVHLAAADLLTGIVPGASTPGRNFPSGKLSNTVLQAGYASGPADLGGATSTTGASAGHYLVLNGTVGAAAADAMRPSDALKIDTKLDDGVSNTGSVRGIGGATCGDGTGYATAAAGATCGLYVRIQG
ncbi:type II secretion system protein [Micavibrio aeruginosavorus]|uniref:type II secretion system protein n=1 Tax=Micavibrio aeruginosavorus TaxID=349221 RepID=UPI003F4A937F